MMGRPTFGGPGERPLSAAFPKGFQPRPSQAGVLSASASIIFEAVSTAFFLVPGGVYAGPLLLGIFRAFQSAETLRGRPLEAASLQCRIPTHCLIDPGQTGGNFSVTIH